MEPAQSKGISSEQTVGVSHKSEPGKKIFKPIPKAGIYYVFTTKYGAEIWYDGSLYVEEYEVIK
jgi:hypothetical protein